MSTISFSYTLDCLDVSRNSVTIYSWHSNQDLSITLQGRPGVSTFVRMYFKKSKQTIPKVEAMTMQSKSYLKNAFHKKYKKGAEFCVLVAAAWLFCYFHTDIPGWGIFLDHCEAASFYYRS